MQLNLKWKKWKLYSWIILIQFTKLQSLQSLQVTRSTKHTGLILQMWVYSKKSNVLKTIIEFYSTNLHIQIEFEFRKEIKMNFRFGLNLKENNFEILTRIKFKILKSLYICNFKNALECRTS